MQQEKYSHTFDYFLTTLNSWNFKSVRREASGQSTAVSLPFPVEPTLASPLISESLPLALPVSFPIRGDLSQESTSGKCIENDN